MRTLSDNTLEYFGSAANPSISIIGTASDQIKIGGSGVGGSYKFAFSDAAAASDFWDFATDLLGKDPAPTKLFDISTGTNGGANRFQGFVNDEIDLLNDGRDTEQSFIFKTSGESVSGTRSVGSFDEFVSDAALLFSGQQLVDGLIENRVDELGFLSFSLADGPDADGDLGRCPVWAKRCRGRRTMAV